MTTSSKKSVNRFFFSIGGVLAVFIMVAALNALVAGVRLRVDLTQDKLFTLSPGTRAILGEIESPVSIRFYASRSNPSFPPFLRAYADRVADLLSEYSLASEGKVQVQRIDPAPDTEAEDSARLDGIFPQPWRTGEPIYLGISVAHLDKKVTLAGLSPERERMLEYDVSRAIAEVLAETRPAVGLMSSLPVQGAANPFAMMMGGQQQGWIFAEELNGLFDVQTVDMNATEIPEEIDVLIVIHPTGIQPETEFAIDQFLLRGGRLIAFLDPLSFYSVLQSQQNQMGMMRTPPPQPSNLPKLMEAWGLAMDDNLVVLDSRNRTTVRTAQGRQELLAVLSIDNTGINNADIVTGQVETLLLPMPGAITGEPVEGLQKEVLVSSSSESQLVESFRAQMENDDLRSGFRPSGEEYALVVRLSGRFKTAFPDGPPQTTSENTPEEGGEEDASLPDAEPQEWLKEGKGENTILIFADSDILADDFSVSSAQFMGQRVLVPFNENLNLVVNSVEHLAGDENLIAVRSRGALSRPFTVIADMQTRAEERFRERIVQLESELNSASTRLNELQEAKDPNQRLILSPEQQKEIEEFRKIEATARRELKNVRRQLRRDIDSLEMTLKVVNIAGMPFLVVVTGVAVALVRRKMTAAA